MSEKVTPGRVVWRELMTKDVKRAQAFYGELFGWKFEAFDMGPGNYDMVKVGEKSVGGLWQMKPDMPGPSMWMSYVWVTDVDAAAKRAVDSGGKVVHGPGDIPNVGRFAVLTDFAGAMVCAFKPAPEEAQPLAMPKAGEFCWETLSTTDLARAEDFYGKVFGWKAMKDNGIPVFTLDGTPRGMVADLQEARNFPPNWMTYVVVDKVEPATERASRLGGNVLVPLIEIPQVGRIGLIADPTGAPLGLYQPLMG